jgi:hypothetical protein
MNEENSEDFHVKCPLLGPFLTKVYMRQQLSWKTSGFRCGCCSNHGISRFFTHGSVCCDVSEPFIASVFTVAELDQVDNAMIGLKPIQNRDLRSSGILCSLH